MLQNNTKSIGLSFRLLILVAVFCTFQSCINQNRSDFNKKQALDEIGFLNNKIDTILYLFDTDLLISQLKPTEYSHNVKTFYNQYSKVIPYDLQLDSLNLYSDINLNNLKTLNQVIKDFKIDTCLKDEFDSFLKMAESQSIDKDLLLLKLKRFEFSLMLDLYINHCCEKVKYLDECYQ